MKFPVQYFVAPEMATDREARGVEEITLSYTFYPTQGFEQAANADIAPNAQASGAAG
jgi:cytochrome c oxidase assembly protein subunit 11